MPHFIHDTCIGCGVCEIKCPTHTITGGKNEKFVIHQDRCIDCSVCAVYCPVSCIQDQHGDLIQKVKPKDIPKAIVDRELCTACEFCIDICPFDCIHLVADPLAPNLHYKVAEVDAAPACPAASARRSATRTPFTSRTRSRRRSSTCRSCN